MRKSVTVLSKCVHWSTVAVVVSSCTGDTQNVHFIVTWPRLPNSAHDPTFFNRKHRKSLVTRCDFWTDHTLSMDILGVAIKNDILTSNLEVPDVFCLASLL